MSGAERNGSYGALPISSPRQVGGDPNRAGWASRIEPLRIAAANATLRQ